MAEKEMKHRYHLNSELKRLNDELFVFADELRDEGKADEALAVYQELRMVAQVAVSAKALEMGGELKGKEKVLAWLSPKGNQLSKLTDHSRLTQARNQRKARMTEVEFRTVEKDDNDQPGEINAKTAH